MHVEYTLWSVTGYLTGKHAPLISSSLVNWGLYKLIYACFKSFANETALSGLIASESFTVLHEWVTIYIYVLATLYILCLRYFIFSIRCLYKICNILST